MFIVYGYDLEVEKEKWLKKNKYSKTSKVQTQHYMQALRRSGLIE